MHHEAVLPVKAAHLEHQKKQKKKKGNTGSELFRLFLGMSGFNAHPTHHVTADVSFPGSYRVPSCRRVLRLPVLFSVASSEPRERRPFKNAKGNTKLQGIKESYEGQHL